MPKGNSNNKNRNFLVNKPMMVIVSARPNII